MTTRVQVRPIRLAERGRGRFVSLPTLTRLAVIAIPVLIVVTAVVLEVTRLGVSRSESSPA